jgi:hypothetical protein
MPIADFPTSILETEIVVMHIDDGHVYHFPILSSGNVSLNGSRVEPNPGAKREARLSVFAARDAALIAFSRTRSSRTGSRI